MGFANRRPVPDKQISVQRYILIRVLFAMSLQPLKPPLAHLVAAIVGVRRLDAIARLRLLQLKVKDLAQFSLFRGRERACFVDDLFQCCLRFTYNLNRSLAPAERLARRFQNKAQPLLNISSLSEIANQHDIADRRPASYGEFFAIARPGETDYLAVCKIG